MTFLTFNFLDNYNQFKDSNLAKKKIRLAEFFCFKKTTYFCGLTLIIMYIKKLIYYSLLALLFATNGYLFSGCSEKEKDPEITSPETALKRSWKVTKYSIDGVIEPIQNCWYKELTFKDNNAVLVKDAPTKCEPNDPAQVSGTYQLESPSLTIATTEPRVQAQIYANRYTFTVQELSAQKLKINLMAPTPTGLGTKLHQIEFAPL